MVADTDCVTIILQEAIFMISIDYWRKLEDDFLSFLTAKGYIDESVKKYKRVTGLLIRYANASKYEAYAPDVGEGFLESEERLTYLQPNSYRFQRTAIRRLNEYLDGEKYTKSRLRANYECPDPFIEVYTKYIEALQKQGLKSSSIKQHRVFMVKLFQDFVKHDVDNWGAVNAQALTGAFSRSTDKHNFASYVKRLFDYLVREQVIKYNYTGILPKIQYFKRIPSVYTEDEIATILSGVNRTTETGKRDYAILLLAARLGMRSSDIRLLQFENVRFEDKLIEFAQHKTGVPQRLTLLPEIADALHDYIDNARSNSTEPYIFLTCRQSMQIPVTASVITNIAAKYFRESGIKFGDRHRGTHALRMSLASALVAENVPYDAVRPILGHEDPNAITHYVKLDVESLRFCALDVPAPSGRFAEYLIYGREIPVND
jgi:integrase